MPAVVPQVSLPTASDAALAAWRRNLIALTGAVFIGFTGFTLVMPFLPLYISQMGVTDVGRIATWTGVTLGVTPAMTALFAPLWGRLSYRFGRRFLVARSLASFVVIMAAMAFATQPWHLFAWRVLQGFFAGYGALTLAMAADSAPPGRMAQSIGLVQTAQRLGPAIGPVIGGLLAGLVGLRATFFVTSAFYAVALALLLALYREPPATTPHDDGDGTARVSFRNVLAFEHFLLLMAVIFGCQFVDRSLGPVLPLHIAAMGLDERHATLVSGVAFSVLACAAAFGHHSCAALLRRFSGRRIISACAIATAASLIAMGETRSPWLVIVTAAIFGLGIGVAMTAAYTAAASAVPEAARATGFGFLTSASLIGMAVSPMAAGVLAAVGLRVVFLVNAGVLLLVGAVVQRVMGEPSATTATPSMEDA